MMGWELQIRIGWVEMSVGIVTSIRKYNVYGYGGGGALRASDLVSRDLEFSMKSSELKSISDISAQRYVNARYYGKHSHVSIYDSLLP